MSCVTKRILTFYGIAWCGEVRRARGDGGIHVECRKEERKKERIEMGRDIQLPHLRLDYRGEENTEAV